MNQENGKSQLAEIQDAIKAVHHDAYQKYPLNSAFPVGCDERAEFINRRMGEVKKSFPKAFK